MSGLTSYPWAYFLTVLINIFIPAAVFVFINSFVYFWRSRLAHQVRALKKLGWKKVWLSLSKKMLQIIPIATTKTFKAAKKFKLARLLRGIASGIFVSLIYSFVTLMLGLGSGFKMNSVKNILLGPLVGIFYGCGILLIRSWSAQEGKIQSADQLRAFMVPQKRFFEKVQEDSGFYESYFQKIYPDGLTEEQALRLRGWCRKRGIDQVPLEPLMPFAGWIFLGYFLTWTFSGSLLKFFF